MFVLTPIWGGPFKGVYFIFSKLRVDFWPLKFLLIPPNYLALFYFLVTKHRPPHPNTILCNQSLVSKYKRMSSFSSRFIVDDSQCWLIAWQCIGKLACLGSGVSISCFWCGTDLEWPKKKHLSWIENVRPISRLFLVLGRALGTLDGNDLK